MQINHFFTDNETELIPHPNFYHLYSFHWRQSVCVSMCLLRTSFLAPNLGALLTNGHWSQITSKHILSYFRNQLLDSSLPFMVIGEEGDSLSPFMVIWEDGEDVWLLRHDKLLRYLWNLARTLLFSFQTYFSLAFISSAQMEDGNFKFCAFFMYFTQTFSNCFQI